MAITGTVPHGGTDTSTKDLDRFRLYLRRGAPGPHAYVILLGLETFDPLDLLRAMKKGLSYRAFERFRRNTSLSFEQIGEFCGLHPLEVQAIADGEVAMQMQGLDPVANGQLTLE